MIKQRMYLFNVKTDFHSQQVCRACDRKLQDFLSPRDIPPGRKQTMPFDLHSIAVRYLCPAFNSVYFILSSPYISIIVSITYILVQ